MKPKYQVGDVLYRKDTQKRATIKLIVGATEGSLYYVISEPLNFKPTWSDFVLNVNYVDNNDLFSEEQREDVLKIWSHIGHKTRETDANITDVEIWILTFKQCLSTMDKNNCSERLTQEFVKSADLAAKHFRNLIKENR